MLNRRALALHLALCELDEPLGLSEFDERLALQKIVHLVQASGVHLGFTYNWYKHGPYSPSLAEEAFSLANERELDSDGGFARSWKLDTVSLASLKKLKQAIDNLPNSKQKRSRQLEIVSSTLWALQREWAPSNRSSLVHKALVTIGGKTFTEEEVKSSLQWLKKYGLVSRLEAS